MVTKLFKMINSSSKLLLLINSKRSRQQTSKWLHSLIWLMELISNQPHRQWYLVQAWLKPKLIQLMLNNNRKLSNSNNTKLWWWIFINSSAKPITWWLTSNSSNLLKLCNSNLKSLSSHSNLHKQTNLPTNSKIWWFSNKMDKSRWLMISHRTKTTTLVLNLTHNQWLPSNSLHKMWLEFLLLLLPTPRILHLILTNLSNNPM